MFSLHISHPRVILASAASLALVGGLALAVPVPSASATGSGGWQCAQSFSFNGASSTRGTSTTSSPPQCGQARIQVSYAVTGGKIYKTSWRQAPNLVKQAGLGYDVVHGHHHVTNAAWLYDVIKTT